MVFLFSYSDSCVSLSYIFILKMQVKKVRDEQDADMSISQAFSIVFSKKPELKLEGLAHNVLQWYLCRMEGWFAADADTISVQCWDQVSYNSLPLGV